MAEQNVDGVLEAVGAVVGTLAEESEPAVEPTGEPAEEPAGEPAVESTVESAGESTPEVPAEVLGLQEEFAQTVNELKDDFLAAEAPSTDALVEGMQSAFDEFVAALAPDTGDVTVEEATPDDGGDEPADVDAVVAEPAAAPLELELDLEGFIAELRAAFEAAMDELINAFGEVTVFAELSEPSGNGRAYGKFLTIYNEMRGVETPDEGSQAPEPVEAEG